MTAVKEKLAWDFNFGVSTEPILRILDNWKNTKEVQKIKENQLFKVLSYSPFQGCGIYIK
jgi:hypothetical protein